MPLSRDHRRFPTATATATATADGGAATSYSAYSRKHNYLHDGAVNDVLAPPVKRMKLATPSWEHGLNCYRNAESVSRTFLMPQPQVVLYDSTGPVALSARKPSEEDGVPVMSRDEIERCSPSRKDGIDRYMETHFRYAYCAYLQILGLRLDLPQTTVGAAIVLCHRFFLRRSHASNDRFLIATAAMFLAAKSEETPCLLKSVISASSKIFQKQNFAFLPQRLYNDWFELYLDRVVEAEQLILTTLNFELEVEHPHLSLTSVLNKLGLSQTVLLNLAWNLVNEGVFLHETNVLNCVIFLAGR